MKLVILLLRLEEYRSVSMFQARCYAQLVRKLQTPINHGVVFVKHKDVVLTSDYWRIVVNFDLSAYEDATTILRADLFRVKESA